MKPGVVMIVLALAACGKKEPAGSSAQKAEPAKVDPAKVEPLPTLAANAPEDQPVAPEGPEAVAAYQRAIAPYIEQGRKSYPDAKKRYLAGLPPDEHFFAVTLLRSPGKSESVFIAVSGIADGMISGTIASEIMGVTGYHAGDAYRFAESDLTDWLITKPDGSEEGNVVGKFLDEYQRQPH